MVPRFLVINVNGKHFLLFSQSVNDRLTRFLKAPAQALFIERLAGFVDPNVV